MLRKEKILREIEEDVMKRISLLLLSVNNGEEINGKVRFMKELFLLSLNIPELAEEADFEADQYGPSSDEIINAWEELEQYDLISNENGKYSIAQNGLEIVDKLNENSVDDLHLITDMKDLCNEITLNELLALVYFSYPEMTIESNVVHRIIGKREYYAMQLFRKEKISLSKASEIAGIPLLSFYKILKSKGISIGGVN